MFQQDISSSGLKMVPAGGEAIVANCVPISPPANQKSHLNPLRRTVAAVTWEIKKLHGLCLPCVLEHSVRMNITEVY